MTLRATTTTAMPPTRSHSFGVRPLRSLASRLGVFVANAESSSNRAPSDRICLKSYCNYEPCAIRGSDRSGHPARSIAPIDGPTRHSHRAGHYPGAMSKPLGQLGEADFSSVEAVLAVLRSRGGRVTSSRRILVQVVFEADGHLYAG